MTLDKALAKTRALLATADTHGVKLPTPTRRALEQHVETAERLGDYASGARQGLANAVLDAVADGQDPAASPAVIRAATAAVMATNTDRSRLRDLLDARVAETLEEHRPAILKSLAAQFEEVAAALVAAHQRLGGINPKDPHAILNAGKQPDDWAEATRSLEAINVLSRMWQNVTGTKGSTWGPYIIGEITAEQWLDNEDLRMADAWDLVNAGVPLRLLTDTADLGKLSRDVNRVREERTAASERQRMQRAFPAWKG